MGKNIGTNISKNLRGKCSQKHLDHIKQPATDALKIVFKLAILKTADATGNLNGSCWSRKSHELHQRIF